MNTFKTFKFGKYVTIQVGNKLLIILLHLNYVNEASKAPSIPFLTPSAISTPDRALLSRHYSPLVSHQMQLLVTGWHTSQTFLFLCMCIYNQHSRKFSLAAAVQRIDGNRARLKQKALSRGYCGNSALGISPMK